ncbi:hypothetical protein Amet_4302 [Alkaliphilus metalliredigens QYMF]|uniref:Uncharacterized protein n=1 Tax=Alkaliphilus metalliredigens (strain QYMF) TaxID=293826 RepID=A6TW08_ALKMQ|nr:hypothetical protein Amet_4302 [Alkaliphilus metalliredigens QYMF]
MCSSSLITLKNILTQLSQDIFLCHFHDSIQLLMSFFEYLKSEQLKKHYFKRISKYFDIVNAYTYKNIDFDIFGKSHVRLLVIDLEKGFMITIKRGREVQRFYEVE